MTNTMNRIRHNVYGVATGLGQKAESILGKRREDALAATVTIAITGLARAGKTTFTTALAHALSQTQQLPVLLPLFEPANAERILATRLVGRGATPFPYDEAVSALTADPPHWPRPTTGVSELSFIVDYKTKGAQWQLVAPKTRLTVNIVDYPGEWLLDLPLLKASFAEWSRDTIARCREQPRAAKAGEWLAAIDAIDGNRPSSDGDLVRLSALYRTFLERCRSEGPGLYLLQPGRFLEPGAVADPTLLQFCPFPGSGPDKPPRGSLAAVLAAHYERYRREIVRPFYRRHFSRFTRQVVLVDLLTALDRGPDAWNDLKLALVDILKSFQTQKAALINRLPFVGARTEKLLFACTKADHITRNNYSNLRTLLRNTVEPSAVLMTENGATVGYEIVTAVKTTKNVTKQENGRTIHCIRGVPIGSTAEQDWDPGDIPDEPPKAGQWPELQITAFRPPPFDPKVNSFRSINLDRALQFLIGDLFK